jgi:hypothetical protein
MFSMTRIIGAGSVAWGGWWSATWRSTGRLGLWPVSSWQKGKLLVPTLSRVTWKSSCSTESLLPSMIGTLRSWVGSAVGHHTTEKLQGLHRVLGFEFKTSWRVAWHCWSFRWTRPQNGWRRLGWKGKRPAEYISSVAGGYMTGLRMAEIFQAWYCCALLPEEVEQISGHCGEL